MKIIHAASELYPYAKTGGLADMVGSLAGALADNGHEVSVFLPGYRTALEQSASASKFPILPLGSGDEVRVLSPRKNLTIFLLCSRQFFDRDGIYGVNGSDFDDNQKRFLWFCRTVAETMHVLDLRADVLHCHDWQTGLLPILLRHRELKHGVSLAGRTMLTIHNIAFQGKFPTYTVGNVDLPIEVRGMWDVEHGGHLNMLKSGILYADQVTTVSPQYAREITTSAFGCGLDGIVAMRAHKLVGVLNGTDSAVWNPRTDVHLPARYSPEDMRGKTTCRDELLRSFSMDPQDPRPVFGMVCRLTEQKGLDLVLAHKDFFLNGNRLLVLGAGEERYEKALRTLADRTPATIGFRKRFDEGLSHLIEAGSDFFLMPSLYEPCGLNQMYSQTYGTVPLVSRVGGLLDTVIDADEHLSLGTGVTFPPSSAGFRDGLSRAHTLFSEKRRFAAVQQRGMRKDFCWDGAAAAYQHLYQDLVGTQEPDPELDEYPAQLSTSPYVAASFSAA